jgi:ABC-2 type transport system ATP-binding protein
MLKIQHLTKKYGAKTAVSDLSLTIAPGEIYGFIGHNGAGKTTTLRCCAGLLSFEEGTIAIDGHDIRSDAMAAKQELAYLPDSPTLFEYLTGIEYLNFIADVFRVPSPQRDERIARYSGQLELTADLAQPISTYSHGMKQKTAIIAAMIHQPKLIMLDEPFVGLDPVAAYQFKQIMHETCAAGGAIFFSTHVLEVAEKLCDKVAIIRQGRLIRTGTMDEVKGDESLEETFLELEKENDDADPAH